MNLIAEDTVQFALQRIGIERSSLKWTDLHLAAGEVVVLPRDGARLAGSHRIVETASAAVYKQWIGFDDDAIRRGVQKSADIDRNGILSLEDLLRAGPHSDTAERAIACAAAAFLFGDSALVERYRPLIERRYAPFRAQLLIARQIVLEAGASLLVDENPAVLIADEVIFRGGSLDVRSGCHATFGVVVNEGNEESR
jgi:hypothetical protein